MSHGILSHDKIVSLEKCWHNLQTIVPEITFDNSGLNWEVGKKTIFVDGEPVPNWQAVVRMDNGLVLNIPKTSYTPIQNQRVYEMIANSLCGVNYKVTSTGSLQDCRKIFIQVQIDGKQEFVLNGDSFQSFITFITSHDGSLGLEVFSTEVRLVCLNTFNASRAAKGNVNLKCYHTKNNETKIKDMEKILDDMFVKREEFFKSLEYLMNKPITLARANQILTGFTANGEELSTRAQNQVEKMVGLFQSGRGNKGQTLYDLWNANTDYYTNEASDNKVKLMQSNMFGSADKNKIEFFDSLLSDSELDALARRGEKLLAIEAQAVTA